VAIGGKDSSVPNNTVLNVIGDSTDGRRSTAQRVGNRQKVSSIRTGRPGDGDPRQLRKDQYRRVHCTVYVEACQRTPAETATSRATRTTRIPDQMQVVECPRRTTDQVQGPSQISTKETRNGFEGEFSRDLRYIQGINGTRLMQRLYVLGNKTTKPFLEGWAWPAPGGTEWLLDQ